jgi:hypothetical protein
MTGANTALQASVYGTRGVPGPNNTPGARYEAVSWTDSSDNLWLYGGHGVGSTSLDDELNDLWKYNPVTNEWVWVGGSDTANLPAVYGAKGVAAPANDPGCRSSATAWTDSAGNFWLFGGWCAVDPRGNPALNDLWKYNPGTGEWTWVSGSSTPGQGGVYGTQGVASASNVPGARIDAVSWVDGSGNFWVFGGDGNDSTGGRGYLNDLWKYDPASGQWTWVSGSDTRGAQSVYGAKGVAAADNVPGARYAAVSWTSANALWLFSGAWNSTSANDLWKFDLGSGQWTFVAGDVLQGGVLHPESNSPSARSGAISWTDAAGKLWLFGGNFQHDLWNYDPAASKWTWVSGSFTRNAAGAYGTRGVGSTSNIPGGRRDAVSWIDSAGALWLFGGYGNGSTAGLANISRLNDLWKTTP